ncbi:hypothetical protein F3Y22_tig00111000pilonHSYRG00174 [Hibiscus syriacus]|uniref:RNase H type-1 domain-containing protein n=1 Tax=Hibiscus syriacus TaxID=106335 RepID=A0A6A2Z9N2_HIBSY|nr:hypothetical protein F3Y22_tig00111000pilonHSYRG00174 [Hibiscus syriacus]
MNGWIALNTNGAVSTQLKSSSIGGIFRDHSGKCLGAFHKKIGFSTILETELWGIYEVIKLAWSYGFEKVIVQRDSGDALKFLSPPSPISPFPAVRATARLLDRDWFVHFMKIYREANAVADLLAKLDDHFSDALVVVDLLSIQLRVVLSRDINDPLTYNYLM